MELRKKRKKQSQAGENSRRREWIVEKREMRDKASFWCERETERSKREESLGREKAGSDKR